MSTFPTARGRASMSRMKRWECAEAYLYLLPVLLGLVFFSIGPIFQSAVISFTDWDIITPMEFCGAANYQRLLQDELFFKSLWNTLYYALASVPLSVVLPLLLAVVMNVKLRGIVIFRTVYFLPVVTSTVAVSTVWYWLYNTDFGLINYCIYALTGIKGPAWLGDPHWAMPAIIIMSIWKSLGYNMVIFLAALQGIPEELFESSEIDGASGAAKFFHITIPLVSPTIFFVLIMSIINSFQVFEQTYIMTQGGPEYATLTLVYYIFQHGFEYYRLGYASAMSWVLFVLILTFTLIQFKLQKKWVFYQ